MHIRIIAIGTKMPEWVNLGYQSYAKRFAAPWSIELHEISAERRTKQSDIPKITAREGEKIVNLVKPNHHVIALDEKGKPWTTAEFSKHLEKWQIETRGLDILIGGPDGLSSQCLEKANTKLSLSSFTLPHPLVRIVIAEQLYRAISILQGHPYHRE